MTISIRPAAPEEKEIIHSLLQPYLDELYRLPGEIAEYKDEFGVYQYPYLDAYWQEVERFPYLIYEGIETVGFALVRKDGDYWEMAEFYIKPEFRRQGIGEKASLAILNKHPGYWQISFNKHNATGRQLWQKLTTTVSRVNVNKGKLDASHDFFRFLAE